VSPLIRWGFFVRLQCATMASSCTSLLKEKVRPICSFSTSRDRDTLFILVQNPTSVHVYWQLSDRKKRLLAEHYGEEWPQLRPSLRIYDITGLFFDGSEAAALRQYEVGLLTSCYVQGLEPGRSYVADYGIWNSSEQFLPLIRSNSVSMPRNCSGIMESNSFDSPNCSLTLLLPSEYDRFSAYTLYPKEKK
jgi:hypothetical protein